MSPQKITPDNFTDTVFTDTDVENNTFYYYIIKSANDRLIEGSPSPELVVNSGQPQIPVGLSADAGNNQVELSWQPDDEYDIAGYLIYRCTNNENDSAFSIIDTSMATDYLDYGVSNGIFYKYRIRTLDNYGYLSDFSDTAFAIPHEADLGILLINANESNPYLNADYDSMKVFYNQLLLSTPEQFDMISEPPQHLIDLAGYHTIVWCNELTRGDFILQYTEYLLSYYLKAGGNLIVAGPNTIYPAEDRFYNFTFRSLASACANLEAVENPEYGANEFIGGLSCSAQYPDFNIDTAKANRIVYPYDENDGRLYGLGALVPRDTSEVIYKYRAVNPDTSNYHGRPIATIHHGKNFNTAILNFPLYYVEPGLANAIFNRVLQDLENNNNHQSPPAPLPEKTCLLRNYPNPFNPITRIEYELDKSSEIIVNIYDILGRKVTSLESGPQQPGKHSIVWEAANLSSGVYFAKLSDNKEPVALKMILIK